MGVCDFINNSYGNEGGHRRSGFSHKLDLLMNVLVCSA